MNAPQTYHFKDDGRIPNSKLPLLLYEKVTDLQGSAAAEWFEDRFAENNWTNSWRNGIYPFHHYHSTSHEVLGIYSGKALVQLGGEEGAKLEIKAGDMMVIPAGVGHKKLSENDLGVVGAYPKGRSHDLCRGEANERPTADQNISDLPLPEYDPLHGKNGALKDLWNKNL